MGYFLEYMQHLLEIKEFYYILLNFTPEYTLIEPFHKQLSLSSLLY